MEHALNVLNVYLIKTRKRKTSEKDVQKTLGDSSKLYLPLFFPQGYSVYISLYGSGS